MSATLSTMPLSFCISTTPYVSSLSVCLNCLLSIWTLIRLDPKNLIWTWLFLPSLSIQWDKGKPVWKFPCRHNTLLDVFEAIGTIFVLIANIVSSIFHTWNPQAKSHFGSDQILYTSSCGSECRGTSPRTMRVGQGLQPCIIDWAS